MGSSPSRGRLDLSRRMTGVQGIKTPDSEPALSLAGSKDPWFQDQWTRDDCTKFIHPSNGSRSVVYSTGHLRIRHELAESGEAQETVLEFLEHQESH